MAFTVGSLRYASTAAFLAFVWADDPTVGTPSKKETYRAFAEKQINYILGDNLEKEVMWWDLARILQNIRITERLMVRGKYA